jgi:hypothetical protein
MLEHTPNHDQVFDVTLRRAIPFMIFAPQSFTAQLAAMLAGLWRHYSSHDSVGDGQFHASVEEINRMLDIATTDLLDPETIVIISDFTLQRSSFNNRLIKLEQEIRDIRRELAKRASENKKPNERIKEMVATSTPVPAAILASTTVPSPVQISVVCEPAHLVEPIRTVETRGRKKLDDSQYKFQLDKMDKLLNMTGLTETTKKRYLKMARSLMVNYEGAPTKEQYLADIASKGCAPATIRDYLNVISKLHKAIESELPSTVQLSEPAVKNNNEWLQSIESKSGNVEKATTVSKPGDRKERLKRMAEHYHHGEILTMNGLRAFALNEGKVLSDSAIDGTLRQSAKLGYTEKMKEPYTYRRTAKLWGE